MNDNNDDQEDLGQHNWRYMLDSLKAAKAPKHPADTGAGNLVNAIVFASRCAATNHPRWIDAQTATSELVERVGWLLEQKNVLTREDVAQAVDYVVGIANLTADPESETET